MPTAPISHRLRLAAVPCAALVAANMLISAPADAAPRMPGKIISIVARPGPQVGQITFTWKQDGTHTTGFRLETALTTFSKTDPTMAKYGRGARLTPIARTRRSITLSSARVAAIGSGVASGNGLFFRFYALNARKSGTTVRAYPYLQAVLPKAQPPKPTGTTVRVASFNIRTAKATQDKRTWLQRAPDVAAAIVSHHPGVVALQELGPGRADGRVGNTNGTARQTDSLESALKATNNGRYQLVRTTPYVAPTQLTNTQGARILYDTSRYILLTRCPEDTAGHSYSDSCTITLPLRAGDGEQLRRRAAVAEFRDRRTGAAFWFVSAHLDDRHSGYPSVERAYNVLRGNQAKAVSYGVARFNTTHAAVVIGGDFNSWQNNWIGNAPHDYLIGQGYYDTSAAVSRVNFRYSTFNDFRTTMSAASQGVGARLDMIFIKGAAGSRRFENVMKTTDPARPSDHNLILADIVL